jgi:hypothetical protein
MSVGALLTGGGGVESLELPPQAVSPNVAAITATDNKFFLVFKHVSLKIKWIVAYLTLNTIIKMQMRISAICINIYINISWEFFN